MTTTVFVTDGLATSQPGTSPTTQAPVDTVAPTTIDASTTIPPTTAPADQLQQLPGVALIDVAATGSDPTRPTFTWAAVAGATSYELVVHGADGRPVWAWTGASTSVSLGGVERPADAEGPTLTGPSTVRVYAFDATAHLLAISPWTPTPTST